ncbi:hypothetical protein [Methylorubrum aminovorans]|uniref:hypothetical protein n=1 Tax=Methylorubrum aminovorans TaxID=269069 RepID=UPI001EDDBAD2|nr:hypothetical protein [Methylorubrum aminovorans]GMA76189.1 hypothetical protein GCM10025880_26060 [Methylorubrum aminovorans]
MRHKLYGNAKTKKIDLLLSEELHALLVEIAETYALEPSTYARSLVVTQLRKVKAVKDAGNE